VGALLLNVDGDFYGTTESGGANGLGTVFKISPGAQYKVLHSFNGADGSSPVAGLVLGTDGNFYGTTFAGGSVGGGTVFKITPGGALTTLHSFDGTDGDFPSARLLQGDEGNLYGTTAYGGNSPSGCPYGCGTVFRITPGGTFTTLHSFNYTDGSTVYAPLVQGSNGSLYGTTFEGGYVNREMCPFGCGTAYRISSQGRFGTLIEFQNGTNDSLGLVTATDGNLYGLDLVGSAAQIYNITPLNQLSTVYTFLSGQGDSDAMLQATNGKFYGTYGAPGAIFSLDTGLGPFVAFVIPTGKANKKVQILGQGLTDTTSVEFNGVPATSFTVVSDTYMTAVVPVGATTGKVVVSTLNGILTSNVDFRIAK
jgi:uncharacterized repeat protein (TIGR03803 family)